MDQTPALLRPVEAGRQLGIGRSMVYQLIGAGELRPIKIGRATCIPAAEIAAYIARRQAEAEAARKRGRA